MNNFYENKEVKGAIVGTIAFFDIFDFPPTANEVRQYLNKRASYLEVLDSLNSLLLDRVIERSEGVYFFPGRKELIDTRKKRYNYSNQKIALAIKATNFFRFIPWVKSVSLANGIGRDNFREGSDIDLFIITETNRLWLTRFFVVSIAKLLNMRPKEGDTKNKICLSFFINEEGMDISRIRKNQTDKYLDFWLLGLVPIYDIERTYGKFLQKNINILRNYPNAIFYLTSNRRLVARPWGSFYKKNFDLLFAGLERPLKKFQLWKMPINLKEVAPKKEGVIIDKNTIKLHLEDRREYFIKKHEEKISTYKN